MGQRGEDTVKKMLKMRIDLDKLLKTKWKKSALDELMKINQLHCIPDDFMILKEL